MGLDADGSASDTPIVLFDGVCNLCNGAVQFVIDHERAPRLRFAPLQSELALNLLKTTFGPEEAERLRKVAIGNGDPDSIVFVEKGRGYAHSTAALRVARYLKAPWSWVFAAVMVPRPIRDLVYRWIARNRYRWFGSTETCRIPTPELRARFLA